MSNESTTNRPSFSAARRWGMLINLVLSIVAVLALLVMANYLAAGYYQRIRLAEHSRFDLSPQTLKVLQTVTNDVDVTIFYDVQGEADIYSWIHGLLKEYRNVNPRIQLRTVDYTRYHGDAALVLSKYKLSGLKDKNFIVFDSAGNTRTIYHNQLSDYDIGAVLAGESREFRRTAFRGEMLFTSAIFSVCNPRPLKAYFLQGHGEADPENTTIENGYGRFAAMLKDEANVAWDKLMLHGTNQVPTDCQLLIIAGPAKAQLAENEVSAIDAYLQRGGRLLVLLYNPLLSGNTGWEPILARWGIEAGVNVVFDQENSPTSNDLLTAQIHPQHAVTKAMFAEGLRMQLVLPRSMGRALNLGTNADPPKVEILAATGTNAVARYYVQQAGRVETVDKAGAFPLVVAVEHGGIQGVSADRGATRIVAVGDAHCLNNQLLDSAANHYFAGFALNWLLAQPAYLLEGLGPRPIKDYRLELTDGQLKTIRWIFLAGVPGGILAFGGLVWFRRRS